ncbi:cytochrome P450 alkane hydroxylase-like protein [Venturia nashicola]|uniref:Cytochrome P450 alkane hydroxylase-like protein n=1 Tax=Venturia nashicola TaxID=86259 RepID=A0A4Z1PH27_9PEZI|nr:cytochrome P450 alkane hydroxylase-like protein [Venturia nashicola]
MLLDNLFQNRSSIVKGCALLFAAWLLYSFIKGLIKDRQIRALGLRAPRRHAKLPYGIDLMYEAITRALVNDALAFWTNNFKNFGNSNNPYTVEVSIGGDRLVLTADPENIKAILATQFVDYGKGEQFNKDWHEFLGDSIFTTDGEVWHDSRQLIRPQFVKNRLSDIKTFEKHVQKLLPLMGGQGQTVDVCDLFFRYTLDAATNFLLGRSVDSLEHDETAFARAFGVVQHVQSIIARAGPLNWLIPRRTFRRELGVMNSFTNRFIDDALGLSLEELEKRNKGEEGYTFLHALATYTRDRKVLRDQLVAVLLAGRDTTACSLSWLFYELSTHPEIVTKLRQEIKTTIGMHKDPEYSDLKSMKYLQVWLPSLNLFTPLSSIFSTNKRRKKNCMNETLRLYPIVPFNVRLALKDTTLPHGGGPTGNSPIGILKGTPIGYSTLAMQRRPDLYPPPSAGFPAVDEFVPERWDAWYPKAWTYIPFNGGPRLCVGQQFALMEMGYTIVRILQRYGRVECRMERAPAMKTDIVLQPAGGVWVAFFEAEEGE